MTFGRSAEGRMMAVVVAAALLFADAVLSPSRLIAAEPARTDQRKEAPQGTAQPPAPAPAVGPLQTPAPGGGPVKTGDILTVDQCVAIALERHPVIIAGSHTAGAASSKVGQARSNYYPQISFSTGYSKRSLITDPSNTVNGAYATSATLTQSIYEFGKTWNQVTIQQRNYAAARSDLQDAANQIVLGVRSAYYNLLQAQKSVEVLADAASSFEQHLEQAKAFFETGVKSKYDVTTAEVNLSNARLSLIRAQNQLKTQRAVLNNALGMPDAPEYGIRDDLVISKSAITYEDAVRRAYANRPDLQAQRARREAADASLSLARKGFFPAFSGSANYSWQDASEDPADPNHSPFARSGWSAGVTLTFPLFNGFLTSYQVSEAKETYAAAEANEENLRQQVLLDVQQAFVSLHDAEESLAVAELTVKQAEENYEIAKGRYEAGVGSIIDETDALVSLRNARLGLISAQVQDKIAEAALRRAMGEQ